jgi:hypothetical protein
VQKDELDTVKKIILDERMASVFTQVDISQDELQSAIDNGDSALVMKFVKSFKRMKSDTFYDLVDECQYVSYREECDTVLHHMRRFPNVTIHTFGLK